MNAETFRQALRELGLPFSAVRTAALLGMSRHAVIAYARGRRPVPGGIDRAVSLYLLLHRNGLPPGVVAGLLGLESATDPQYGPKTKNPGPGIQSS